jgi:hypothetical protein
MGPTTLSQKKNLGVAISCDMRQSLLNRLEEVERIIVESFAPRIIIFIRDYKPKEEDNGHVRVGFGNSSRCYISSKTKLLRIYCECCAFLLSSKRDKSIFERLFISSPTFCTADGAFTSRTPNISRNGWLRS